MPLSLDYIRTYVRDALGEGVVEVELLDKNIQAGIDAAVKLVNAYTPIHRWGVLPFTPVTSFVYTGTTAYSGRFIYSAVPLVAPASPSAEYAALAASVIVVPGLQRIVDLVGVRERITNGADIDLFDPLIYISGGIQNAAGLAAYSMSIAYLKEARRIFGSEADFRFQWEYDTILQSRVGNMYVSIPTITNYKYGIEMIVSVTADDDAQTGLAYISDGSQEWFCSYVLACCKVTLAHILGKFGGGPGEDGDPLATDAAFIREEGLDAKKDLRDEIMRKRMSLPPIFG